MRSLPSGPGWKRERGRGVIWLKAGLLVAAPALLGLGITQPLLRFETLYFFSETPSLLAIVASLWREGSGALAILVGCVSILFPLVKLVVIAAEFVVGGVVPSGSPVSWIMPHLARWSMMDVLLVAIVVFAAKTSGLAAAVSQPGLWCYAASAVCAGILQALVGRART